MKIGEIGEIGYLKIDNGEDRAKVAGILFNNGYTVSIARRKKNGKTYEYFVKYELKPREIDENENS